MAFMLRPYDATIDLSNREDRKLFNGGCKRLDEKQVFDAKKGSYLEFVKLIKKDFEYIRVMPALNISIEWSVVGRVPTVEEMVDIFNLSKVQKELISSHVDRV